MYILTELYDVHKSVYTKLFTRAVNDISVNLQVKRDVGEVDILVNNAGIVTGKKFLDCPDHMIQKTFEVNTIAHFWVRKHAFKKTVFACTQKQNPFTKIFLVKKNVSLKI